MGMKQGLMRSNHRFPMRCGVDYLTATGVGHGLVLDLSRAGLCVEGSHGVHVGMRMTLVLYLPDSQPPAQLDCMAVRWTSGKQFGPQAGAGAALDHLFCGLR